MDGFGLWGSAHRLAAQGERRVGDDIRQGRERAAQLAASPKLLDRLRALLAAQLQALRDAPLDRSPPMAALEDGGGAVLAPSPLHLGRIARREAVRDQLHLAREIVRRSFRDCELEPPLEARRHPERPAFREEARRGRTHAREVGRQMQSLGVEPPLALHRECRLCIQPAHLGPVRLRLRRLCRVRLCGVVGRREVLRVLWRKV